MSVVMHQWFSGVMQSLMKIIGEIPHQWPKIVIHGFPDNILFITRYFMLWTYNLTENMYRWLISLRSLMMVFSNLALW